MGGGKFLPPILQIRLLKMERFHWFCPKRMQKRPNISAWRTFFQKSSLTIIVLRWTIRFLERKYTSCQKCRCPNNLAKKQPELGKNGTFLFVKLGHHHHWDEVHFLPGELVVQRRTTNVSERFFEEMSDRPRYGGLISRLQGNGDQKLGNGISKNGAKNALKSFQQLFRIQN